MTRSLNPWKNKKDVSQAVISWLMPKAPFPVAPLFFWTDEEVMICPTNWILWEPGLVNTCPKGNGSPSRVEGRYQGPQGTRMTCSDFPSTALPANPGRPGGA